MEGKGCCHVYRYCMRNLSAALGTHTTDGCAEYLIPENATAGGASNFLCAACGCHRSFHWKNLPSFFFPAPLRSARVPPEPATPPAAENPAAAANRRKRERTKFTAEQSERMRDLADSLGWRVSKKERDQGDMGRLLEEAGVSRKRFRVWMHNHRNEAAANRPGAGVIFNAGVNNDNDDDSDVGVVPVGVGEPGEGSGSV